jgi:hypothetical protein
VFRGVLAVVAASVIWGLALAGSGSAAPSCWQQLVHDWADGRIAGTYPVSCYRQALARMPEDLQVYSSAPDDIEAALQKRVHQTGSRSLAASTAARSMSPSAGRFGIVTVLGFAGGLILLVGSVLVLAAGKGRRT